MRKYIVIIELLGTRYRQYVPANSKKEAKEKAKKSLIAKMETTFCREYREDFNLNSKENDIFQQLKKSMGITD